MLKEWLEMQNQNSKKTSKLVYLACIAISLTCALASGLVGGICLALNYHIYAIIFIAIGFAHARTATKAYDHYRHL
jgi:hypothetical protein